MKEEYGLFVWPCSVILAEYVWQQRSRFSGAAVVELGAGTSLPGLVAAKVGADVTLTDDANRPEVLAHMRRQCDLNNLKCKIMGLTWGLWDSNVFDLHPNIILGADVLYDANAFDDLFATVTFLLENSQPSSFVTSYHNRRYLSFLCKLQLPPFLDLLLVPISYQVMPCVFCLNNAQWASLD
nr:methyltransferase-like protein 23 isoform X1 [Ipomoea batatas]GMC67722.1 methyltransferase-like protein 23 isoform X1 [Ipomoea batatas]